MNWILHWFSQGLGSIGEALRPRSYVRPRQGAFRTDQAKLGRDIRQVGADSRTALDDAGYRRTR